MRPIWRLFHCFVLFHRLRTIQEFDPLTRKVRCVRCGRYFAMSDRYEAFFEWEDDCERYFCETYGLDRTLL